MLGNILKGIGPRDASPEGTPRYAMAAMNLSLLREKIVVRPAGGEGEQAGAGGPVLAKALSNRLALTLSAGSNDFAESFVVRAHTMHLCTRMAAGILQDFQARGFLANRLHDSGWARMWKEACGPFDTTYNLDRWCTIYHDGLAAFSSGPANPLLSAMEAQQAKAESGTGYDQAVFLVQDAFEQAGRAVQIEYESNIGLVAALDPDRGRCSLILRGGGRTTTFNFTAGPKPPQHPRLHTPHCLTACAAFLEGIQLSFAAGRLLGLMDRGDISRAGDEARMVAAARRRLGDLNREIGNMEATMAVRYRPERPEFARIVVEVQEQARRAPGARRP